MDQVTAGLTPRVAWQFGSTILGALISWGTLGHAARSLDPFLGRAQPARRRRALALTWLSYLVGGVVATGAALVNPMIPALIVLSAAAASFGGEGVPAVDAPGRGGRPPDDAGGPPDADASPGLGGARYRRTRRARRPLGTRVATVSPPRLRARIAISSSVHLSAVRTACRAPVG